MKQWKQWCLLCVIVLVLIAVGDFYGCFERTVSGKQFGITDYQSGKDQNENGVDDVQDFVAGARNYVESAPVYGSRYYAGGYPNDGYGVCTDVIHHAFSAAGYSLKQMVDADIVSDPQAYGITTADPNIDFRRVDNLLVFFSRHAQQLSNRFDDPFDWQPGDIVIYHQHIGICSDRRSMQGYPLLIHFDPIGARERDELQNSKVIGHFRWK